MTAGSPVSPIAVGPAGLSARARSFVEVAGIRVPGQDIRRDREARIGHGVPAAEVDRVSAFQDRWGGLALPPAPFYEGGPRILNANCPEWMPGQGWSFEAGDCRGSMAYRFMIGPDGAFGIDAYHWTPLHADTDGWVESLALADHARRWARTVTRIKGKADDALDLGGFEPVPEVRGAHIYSGLDGWGLHGG